MTRIIKMEAKGFKSFANKTEIVFGERFNCIIGPNGSGKSNVVDAICFVMGKGSAKGLRAEKSANLIYNGGKTKQPAKQGEVSLFFDNQDRTFNKDEDVVKLTRIVKPSGSSTYKINDETCTRQQLLDFLARANIEPDGYNIILQGDIARIIEMSGIERRQVIEEMAGIGIYEDKKQKAMRELDKVESGLQEGSIILSERQAHLKELKKERDQAIKFKEIDAALKSSKKTLVHVNIEKKQEELDALDEKAKQRQEEINKVEEQIKEQKQVVTQAKQRIKDINKEIEEKGEQEQVKINKQIEELKVKIATDQHRTSSCDNEIERVNSRIANLKQSITEIQEKVKASDDRQQELQKTINQKQEQHKQVQEKIAVLKKKFNLEGASDIEQRIEAIDKEADELQKNIQTLREKLQDSLREKDRLDIQLEHMDEKIAKIKELEKEHKGELDKLQQKKTEFKKATVELSQCLSQDTKIGARLASIRTKHQECAQEVSRIEARQAAMLERQGGDIAIKRILENKSSFKGVRGTVSQLGVVDSKYATALEVAGGNKLKGIVVESDKQASDCIQYLRDNKFGVASFFPLNKIKARSKDKNLDSIAQAKGVHGYAIDLIEFEPEFKNVMSFVFGNTIVVDSLDVARRIGIGTCKMVTLQGDLAESSGAMRGGFQRNSGKGGVFSEKQTQTQLVKAQKDLAASQAAIGELEKEKQDNEEQIMRLRELKATLEGEIIKTEKALYINADDAGVSTELKKEFTQRVSDIEKTVREQQNEVSKLTTKLTQLKVERQTLRAKVSDIRNPTKLAELNTFEEQSQKMREKIAGLTAQLEQTTLQSAQMFQPEIDNINKVIKQHEKEIETFTKEKQALVAQIKKDQADLKDKEVKQAAFYKQFKSLLEERNKQQALIERTEERIIALEEKIRDLERKNSVVSIEVARIKAEVAALEEEQKQYAQDIALVDERDIDKLKRNIYNYQQRIDNLGHVNMKALDTYEQIETEYNTLLEKKQKLEQEKLTIEGIMTQIEQKKIEIFTKIFDVLNTNFKNLFNRLSTKGDAYLELENPDSPFEGGAFIKVRLSGKKFMDIRSLSGGEKAMTALAFIFAIQEYNPASFYVLDEVDAALDKKNAERLAELVNSYSNKAQFVTISHNDGVIGAADLLYGVSMDEHGMSQVVSLKL